MLSKAQNLSTASQPTIPFEPNLRPQSPQPPVPMRSNPRYSGEGPPEGWVSDTRTRFFGVWLVRMRWGQFDPM